MYNDLPDEIRQALNQHHEDFNTTDEDYIVIVRPNRWAFFIKSAFEKLSQKKKKVIS